MVVASFFFLDCLKTPHWEDRAKVLTRGHPPKKATPLDTFQDQIFQKRSLFLLRYRHLFSGPLPPVLRERRGNPAQP